MLSKVVYREQITDVKRTLIARVIKVTDQVIVVRPKGFCSYPIDLDRVETIDGKRP